MDTLEGLAGEILQRGGLDLLDARHAAHGLVHADLHGVSSHGVLRLAQYVESLQNGAVNPRPHVRTLNERGATALIEADGGYGYRPATVATDLAVDIARRLGVAFVGVRNSHHFGMAGLYTARGAGAGMVTFVWTNGSPRIAPPGASVPVVGNNPLSWAIPRRAPHPPIVLDMALSVVAFGKIRLARAEGREIPPEWGRDLQGRPTTDAEEAFRSGLLGAIGDHKGYGLSVVAELLAGCLTGSPFGLDSTPHGRRDGGVGHVLLAIDPETLGARGEFEDRVEALVRQIKSADPAGAAYLPGELEQACAARQRRDGIELSPQVSDQVIALARRLGVSAEPLLAARRALGATDEL